MANSAHIIDGTALANQIKKELKVQIESLKTSDQASLALVRVGHDDASGIYLNAKQKACAAIGIKSSIHHFEDTIQEDDLCAEIEKLNDTPSVHGILVQAPLPKHISTDRVFAQIDPRKDVDGFHPINAGKLARDIDGGLNPCTPMGVLKMLQSHDKNLTGKNVVIIGRSSIVGRPLAHLLTNHDMTVTLCHSKTKALHEHTLTADIIITALGKAKFLQKQHVSKNAIIIDVGINKVGEKNGKPVLVGDADYQTLKNHVTAITPVPGGVGPMTIAYLLSNTLTAFKRQNDL